MRTGILVMMLFVAPLLLMAQSPGLIVSPAGGNGITPLNPNGDGFSSATTAGFTTSDIIQSEIPYKIIPPAILEPTSDLLRGPGSMFSDLVRDVDGSGFYVYNDGTNLLMRMRIGNIISGSKGYSVLIDTDGKFGNTGLYADPNYQAATTGSNGNPGFEIEITFESNFRVAVYNVDGTSTPVLINSYPVNTHSQISAALSYVSNTPDYFYDFYVPLSVLGITASTPIRLTATTVMAPQAAIGGPKSDIYGVDDAATNSVMKSWETVINTQPPFTLNDINSGGSGVSADCTAAPAITGPVQAGSGISVSGTWTALDVSKPASATITLYFQNGTIAGTTTATSGNTWTVTGLTLTAGQVLYAKAQASGESMCLQSNNVSVVSCSPANTTTTTGLAITCITRKGIKGDRPANAAVRLYTVTSSGLTLLANDNSTTYLITYPTATTWNYDGQNGGGTDPCTSAQNDINDGSYAITGQVSGQCESGPAFGCLTLTATATPTITQTVLYPKTTSISGTAAASATVRLYINHKLYASATADVSGAWSFSNLVLALNDVLNVYAQSSALCMSSVATRTVSCFTTPPVINTDNNGNISTAASAITGKSSEPAGTVVTVLENGVVLGTTTVQSNGTWSYNHIPVSARSYTATQKNGSCAASSSSASVTALAATTVCPTITGSYTASATSVTGTLPSAFTGTVRLYQDAVFVGSVAVSSATTWSITVNSNYNNALYTGGVLTVTAQVSGGAEKTDCASTTTVACSAPAAPSVSPANTTIDAGQTVDFSVSNSVSGIIYSIIDASTSSTYYATSKFGSGSSMTIPTSSFSTAGTYDVLVKATSLSGPGCTSTSAARIMVNAVTLPFKLVRFTGHMEQGAVQLEWLTNAEEGVDYYEVERSENGIQFHAIGKVKANNTATASYRFKDPSSIAGTAWYRLRMVDQDELHTYSQVIRMTTNDRALQLMSVNPNPFRDQLQVNVKASQPALVRIRIVDMMGRERVAMQKLLGAGEQVIQLHALPQLSKGIYVLQVQNDNNEILGQQRIEKL